MKNHNLEKKIEKLFNENFHSLVFSSFYIVKDYGQAEDIVQNVFVKIWQNYEKVKHISNLKSYIYTAVRNSSFNFLRDKKLLIKGDAQIELLGDKYLIDAEGDDNKRELLNEVHKAVDKLPDKWREAFILSKYEKLKYYEIAKEMNVSNKTVEKYISKALKILRVELKHLITAALAIFFS